MAIAISSSGIVTTFTDTTSDCTWSVTTSSGMSLLVVAVLMSRATSNAANVYTPTSMTYNGSAMTIAESYHAADLTTNHELTLALAYIASPASGTNDVVANFSTTPASPNVSALWYWQLTGTDTSTVEDTSGVSSVGNGAISLSLTTGTANSLILGAAVAGDGSSPSNATVTWDTGPTEENEEYLDRATLSTAYRATTSTGSYGMGFTEASGGDAFAMAIAILEAAAAVSVTPASANATATAAIGAAVKGSASATPDAAQATATAAIGGIAVATQLTPATAQATATAAIGGIAIATQLTPATAQATATAAIGAVAKSSISLTPATAQATATAAIGAVSIGDLVLSPTGARTTATASIGAAVKGSLSTTPGAAQSQVAATLGAVAKSSISLTPATAQAIATARLVLGAVNPSAAQAIATAAIGAAVKGSITLTPATAQALATAAIVDAYASTRTFLTLSARSADVTIKSRTVDITLYSLDRSA